MLAHFHALVKHRSQLVVATHSPILLAYPHADIWECSEDGLRKIASDDVEGVQITRRFLRGPERMVEWLLGEEEP